MLKESLFRYILASDADSRTLATKRNKTGYGTEIEYGVKSQFGSCTASTPSKKSYYRALNSFNSLGLEKANLHDPATVSNLYNFICESLLDIFSLESKDCSIFLTPSGTDVEMLASSILVKNIGSSTTNFVLAPAEIGSGSVKATEGRRFSSISPDGSLGEVGLREFSNLKNQTVKLVEFRSEDAHPRNYDDWEAELFKQLNDTKGRKVVHYVNCTKTGLEVPKISTVKKMQENFGEEIDFVVDAAQGRMQRQDIKTWLDEGKIVFTTGSKFFSSPPFCCALFVPKRYNISNIWTSDFHTYFDQLSFPESSSSSESKIVQTKPRTGHLVRWLFGIGNMAAFYSIPEKIRNEFIDHFYKKATESINQMSHIFELETPYKHSFPSHNSIVSFYIKKQDLTNFVDYKELRSLYYFFLNHNERFHIPQPTKLLHESGEVAVFRLSIGSDMIEELWETCQKSSKSKALDDLSSEISNCLEAISSSILD